LASFAIHLFFIMPLIVRIPYSRRYSMKRNTPPGQRITRRDFVTRSAAVFTGLMLGALRPTIAQQVPSAAGTTDLNILEELVAANHILAQQGIVDGFGHVSARHNHNPNRYLLSRSLAPELVTADDIMEFDLDSSPVDAKGRTMYTERFIHGEIYKARPDVKAVVHNHSPSVIPFGVSTVPLRPVYHMAAFIGDGVPVFDIRKAAGITDMLVGSTALGRALAQALGSKSAVLMRGHGASVVGSSLPIAVGRSIYLELNARILLQALALGGEITYLDPDEARKVIAAGEYGGYQRAWELWKRKAIAK
jgi:ribulose-5-phosphate 4-epimerase/fuculose-1-phosphate aldolase